MRPEYRDGELIWDNNSLSELADTFGTPLHVISIGELRSSIRSFLNPFQKEKLPIACYYSVKTNPIPYFLKCIKEEGIGASVIPPYELWLAEKIGFTDIIVNGPAKSEALYHKAMHSKVKMFSLESEGEILRALSMPSDGDDDLRIGIRICPRLSTLNQRTSSGAKNSPYGLTSDEAISAAEKIQDMANLRFVGFHMHIGSGIQRLQPYKKALKVMELIIEKAQDRGLKCSILNIGGGIGSSTAPLLNLTQIALSMITATRPSSSDGNTRLLDDLAKEISRFRTRLARKRCEIEEIALEPGRRISASIQLTLLTALEVVEGHGGNRYIICDGGAMRLSPMLLMENHNIFPVFNRHPKRFKYTVIGNLPSMLDRVSSGVMLPPVKAGDRLAVLDTGAYNVTFNNNFAGPRPGIVMINKNKYELIRRAETFDDVVSMDTEFPYKR